MTEDGAAAFLGTRGFAVPGDYATRILIMINGHYMTDNVHNASGTFLQDFGLDMDLVERIEVIRGPSSALYGSNGVFATINVVTQAPVDHSRARATAEAGSFGEMKEQVSASMYLGKGVNLLVSGSVFHGGGRSAWLNREKGAEADSLLVDGLEKQTGYHSFLHATWRNWSFMALMNDWRQSAPASQRCNGSLPATLLSSAILHSVQHFAAEICCAHMVHTGISRLIAFSLIVEIGRSFATDRANQCAQQPLTRRIPDDLLEDRASRFKVSVGGALCLDRLLV